ncbi:MAG: aminodeoxychorismate/anthranilate synthase component II [Planctomycetota bacterium]
MILLIDNYDSFTYNLVQRIGELYVRRGQPEPDLRVVRNDKITAAEAVGLDPSHVIVSPGPCTPSEAGVSCAAVEALAGRVPVLGVCLGHQSIGQVFGMTVARHRKLMHGKTSPIHHDGRTVFEGLSNPFVATRYHSLVITAETFDDDRFETSAWCDDDGERVVMGLRARPGALGAGRDAPLEGVQFHPESFMTLEGPGLLANFLGLPRPEPEPAPVEVPLG